MADIDLYWDHIGKKQDAATARAREASPVTVQVPKTGEQLILDRSFQTESSRATVTLTLVPESLFRQADVGVWCLGLAFVLFFRFAVVRLKAWVEVSTVALFLATEVSLELSSPALADEFLLAGLVGLLVIAVSTLAIRFYRDGLRWE
jgi:hypothetical protein